MSTELLIQETQLQLGMYEQSYGGILEEPELVKFLLDKKNYMSALVTALQKLAAFEKAETKRAAKQKELGGQKEYTDAYFVFYEKRIGVKPKFGAADGKAIKEIKIYLESAVSEPLLAWQYILSNWSKLTPFIANQCTALGINKNINEIMSQLKNGTTKSAQLAQCKHQAARDVLASFD
jgi:hypothetical protein